MISLLTIYVEPRPAGQFSTIIINEDEKTQKFGPESFKTHQLIGEGSFGEVFLVERKLDQKLFAMKVLEKEKIRQEGLKKYALTERNVMK